jgi:ATP-dependent DNA helicase RecQ
LATDSLEELDEELFRRLRDTWRHVEDKGNSRFIVYCHTAKAAEAFMELVNQHNENIGFSATIYHSKMERQVKEMSYSKWKRGEVKLLIGTGAIGAGMDYAHVRGVWHRGFTSSLLDYIQEVGRAGRDGREAICVLLHSRTVEAECRRFMRAEDMDKMSGYVEEAGCLRSHLTKFINGLSIDCFSSEIAHCMHCEVALAGESLELSAGSQKTFDGEYNGVLNQMAFRDLMGDRNHILSGIRMVMDVLETRCGVCWFGQRTGRQGMNRSINHDVTMFPT